jgi:hypothetical protein
MKFTSLAVAALCLAARAEAFTGPQMARHARFGVVSTVRHCLRFSQRRVFDRFGVSLSLPL